MCYCFTVVLTVRQVGLTLFCYVHACMVCHGNGSDSKDEDDRIDMEHPLNLWNEGASWIP